MDANGTRFHLLLGRQDWDRCTGDGETASDAGVLRDGKVAGFGWDEERSELTLFPELFQFPTPPDEQDLRLEDRRGAGRDRFGNWYWIGPDESSVRVKSAGSGATTEFWRAGLDAACATPVGDFRPVTPTTPPILKLAGLAITEDHYLVVGVLQPAGCLVFDLAGGGAPLQIRWPDTVRFAPFDMAARPGGGVWILDRVNRRYWGLDRRFNVTRQPRRPVVREKTAGTFQPAASLPVTPEVESPPAAEISGSDGWPLPDENIVAIEALPDDSVLFLHSPGAGSLLFSEVSRYRFGERVCEKVSLSAMREHLPAERRSAFRLVGHDFAFVRGAEAEAGRLFVVADGGNQAMAFDAGFSDGELRLEPVPAYFPMRSFGGKGLVAAGGQAFYDFAEGWIPLVEQFRPRYELEATLLTPLFDGREPDCVWHRLLLDGCLPPETEVRVASRAANDETELLLAPWNDEPEFYRRSDGSEQPFAPRFGGSNCGTWELLFQKARGRWLQLKLTLRGNSRTTPRLRALRAYYPRFSYLKQYLPAVYRADRESASFLDRFLANLEGIFTALEDKLAAVQVLLDVRSAPPETLAWLAGWFGIALDPAWDERKQRLFLRHAMEFFQYRGTIRGLQMALRLALTPDPGPGFFSDDAADRRCAARFRIVEKFRTRRTPGVMLGDPTDAASARELNPAARWQPAEGAAALHRRYREFLAGQKFPFTEATRFPLAEPKDEKDAVPWREFARDTLGFIPAAASDDLERWHDFLRERYGDIGAFQTDHGPEWTDFDAVPFPENLPEDGSPFRDDWNDFIMGAAQLNANRRQTLWQEFLARRYRRIADLNALYGTKWPAFTQVRLPREVPSKVAALQDWFQFEAVVLMMHQAAHKFVVLLPVSVGDFAKPEDRLDRLALARRVIELEKPAHTVFDVKFYWAMFRVGEARLGEDTLVGLGSRAPELLTPLILNQSYLAESFLAPAPPRDASGRFLSGSDAV